MPTIELLITGSVQAVGFRYHAQKKAQQLGLTGFIKNQSDGSVYAQASGTQTKLDEFVNWCHHGSPQANVDSVSITPIESLSEDMSNDFIILK